MSKNNYIVLLAILGDPDVHFGITGTGGYNKTVCELLNYLKNTDKRIIVITNANKYNSTYNTAFSENITVYRIDFQEIWESHQEYIVENIENIIKYVEEILLLPEFKDKISLIHSFYWVSGFVAAKIKGKYAIPFIHTVISLSEDKVATGVLPHAAEQGNYERFFLPLADLIFAITPQELNTLNRKYNIPEDKIRVVGRSVNSVFPTDYEYKKELQFFDDNIGKPTPVYDSAWWENGAFLYVGRIVEIKGIHQIVSAWIFARKQYNITIPLWIVGGTPQQIYEMREKLLSSLHDLSEYEENRQIVWWGNLDSKGISTLMRKAQAVIMHSRFEAGGRVVVEALSGGVPVIATPYGFAKDYVYNGYNGYITQFNDIKHLAEIMSLFSEQPYLSSVLGTSAYNFMKEVVISWDYFKNHIRVYDSYINRSGMNIKQLCDTVVPSDLNSYKSRKCVTVFPYFNTDRSISVLSELIFPILGRHQLSKITRDDNHSEIYLITAKNQIFYLKTFYHIITDRFSRLQYRNTNVISAQEQVSKALDSTKHFCVADLITADCKNLMYIIPRYDIIEEEGVDVLLSFWKEAVPDKRFSKLYSEGNFKELGKLIEKTEDPLINSLFCAEIAYKKMFCKHKLPTEVDQKIRLIMKKSPASFFGLNYGKEIQGHIALIYETAKLLPTHSHFIGEIGYDLVLTYIKYNRDDIGLWKKIKMLNEFLRLDLLFLIVVYAVKKASDFPKTIRYILDL